MKLIKFIETELEGQEAIHSPIYFGALSPNNSISILKSPSRAVSYDFSGSCYDCFTYQVMSRHNDPSMAYSAVNEILLFLQRCKRGEIPLEDNCYFSKAVISKHSSFAFMEEHGFHIYTGEIDLYFERLI